MFPSGSDPVLWFPAIERGHGRGMGPRTVKDKDGKVLRATDKPVCVSCRGTHKVERSIQYDEYVKERQFGEDIDVTLRKYKEQAVTK